MPNFIVIKRLDAFYNFEAKIEADTAEEALAAAERHNEFGEGNIEWFDRGVTIFQHAEFEIED